ncbi:hypothetical protein MSAN_01815400 [Mycena sanguinolenta]|uniref:Uncharacterized protein n=1 Tax=Mycena sanguinolenta TaxID=230812 RepID=A0A8H6XU49_9AGAR|nr:hypothetical protein MSAN_01815400 [Mycena sanguinolenta]
MSSIQSRVRYLHLIHALSIVQTLCTLTTAVSLLYSTDNAYPMALLFAMATYPFSTAVIAYRMLPVSRRADPSHSLSRVGAYYDQLLCRIIVGVTYVYIWFIATSMSEVLRTMRTSCASSTFFTQPAECAALGMQVFINCVVTIVACIAAYTVRRRAIEVHGTEIVLAPPFNPPFFSFWSQEQKPVPAWKAAHVADLAGDAEKPLI